MSFSVSNADPGVGNTNPGPRMSNVCNTLVLHDMWWVNIFSEYTIRYFREKRVWQSKTNKKGQHFHTVYSLKPLPDVIEVKQNHG